jgi:hypothetical protein
MTRASEAIRLASEANRLASSEVAKALREIERLSSLRVSSRSHSLERNHCMYYKPAIFTPNNLKLKIVPLYISRKLFKTVKCQGQIPFFTMPEAWRM